MTTISTLQPREAVRLDHGKVQALVRQLGANAAEDVLCRAMEDIAGRLALIARATGDAGLGDMHKAGRGLIAVAEQVGMITLARVARDVTLCIERGDGAALGATRERLIRVGDRSLSAMWDAQDQSM